MAVLKLDEEISLDDFLNGVKRVVSLVKPNWNLEITQFKMFTEGISNQLMGIFHPEESPGILVRVYGIGTELFVDRLAEQETMLKLAAAGLGPNLLATFVNGIVYDYVPGTVLTVDNVTDGNLWPLVAQKLGAMHRLAVKGDTTLWQRLQKFLNLIPESLFQKYTSLQEIYLNKSALADEVQWLQTKLQSSSQSPIVFCHNDLLLANVVIDENGHSVTFIDYEYASANYQAFDIANHFNEYAGVDTVDYSRLPSENYKRKWLREYLMSYQHGKEPTFQEINQLLRQVINFTPASHMLWALWALVQAQFSQIAFDFAGYAVIRFNEYVRSKSVI